MDVAIHYKGSRSSLHFTCYDAGEGVWRVQDGIGYVHLLPLFQGPGEHGVTQWRAAVRLKDVAEVEIREGNASDRRAPGNASSGNAYRVQRLYQAASRRDQRVGEPVAAHNPASGYAA